MEKNPATNYTQLSKEKNDLLLLKQNTVQKIVKAKGMQLLKIFYKLIEFKNKKKLITRQRLQYVVNKIRFKKEWYVLGAYNGLKQRTNLVRGVFLGDEAMRRVEAANLLKINFCKLKSDSFHKLREIINTETQLKEFALT